jgi:hypothetical protein
MGHPVALFNPGDAHYNTIALQGVDIIIPLEEDLDCDPLQDDEIRLLSLDGNYEKVVKASDSDAVPDDEHGIIYYRFQSVPVGVYKVSVLVGQTWVDVFQQILVSPKGVWNSESRLGRKEQQIKFDIRREETSVPPDRVAPELLPRYIDLNETYQDEES